MMKGMPAIQSVWMQQISPAGFIKHMNLTARIKRPYLVMAIILCLFSAFAIVTAIHNIARGCACTDNADAIFNNLRQIDAAKAEWVVEHPGVKKTEFSQQDLSPYVQTDTWRTMAGEIYLLHGPGQPTEALTTRQVDWMAPGMIMRFGTDDKVEVITNVTTGGIRGK
jgi:hypothetical protein